MGSQPLPHYETSAKTAVNVEDAFLEVSKRALIYEDYKKRSQPQLFVPPPGNAEPINLRHQNSSTYSDRSSSNGTCC